ncbi:MAG: IPT/TIG domain-containing protein, partial [Acidobacteriota bacterium]|nr:IPT/TIG domain-containing protein [Acidobacteriota bacterium]
MKNRKKTQATATRIAIWGLVLLMAYQPAAAPFTFAATNAIPSNNTPTARVPVVSPTPAKADDELGASAQSSPFVTVSAANFDAESIAPGSIVAGFGSRLATTTQIASSLPLPTSLGGTTLTILDSQGLEHRASFYFVSPNQINYLIPQTVSAGVATVIVTSGDGAVSRGTVEVRNIAPAIFTANASGSGVPAANLLRIYQSGATAYESISQFDSVTGRILPKPIDLGPDGERVFLILYSTGLRKAPDANGDGNANETVRLLLGGTQIVPSFVGAAPGFEGLDQINAEIPRNLARRGRVSLGISGRDILVSNLCEVEIGGAPDKVVPIVMSFTPDSVQAGQELTITGSGFSSTFTNNIVRIGGAEANVVSATTTTIRAIVPYGAESGPVSVRIANSEGRGNTIIRVRTSLTGMVEDTRGQPLSGIPVRLNSPAMTVTTNDEGVFTFADIAAGAKEIEVDGSASAVRSLYPKVLLRTNVIAGRHNLLPRPVSLQSISNATLAINSGVISALSPDDNNGAPVSATEQSAANLSVKSGGVTFEVPSGANISVNSGATVNGLTLTAVENGLTPARLPGGEVISAMAQVTPFGVSINPGAKLIFPNQFSTRGPLAVGTKVKLFRLNQTAGGDRLGEFVEAGEATVSADRQTIETAENAITETGMYFVSVAHPTITVIGRALDSDRLTPVRNAIVRLNGQEAFTDGNGGFVLRSVAVFPFNSFEKITITPRLHLLRPNGRKESSAPSIVASGSVVAEGILDLSLPLGDFQPDSLRFSPATANRSPVIVAPLAVNLGDSNLDVNFTATDPERNPITVTVTGATFAIIAGGTGGLYQLRLSPGSVAAGAYTLTITARDSLGASATHTITVNKLPSAPTIAGFSPTSGTVGAEVTITGTGLQTAAGNTIVTFAGAGSLRLPAFVSLSSATQLKVHVPNGAVTGTIQVKTAAGLATSAPFTVSASQDFNLAATPPTAVAVQGSRATLIVTAISDQPDFTQLVKLSVTGAPAGATAAWDTNQITAGATATLTLALPRTTSPGSYSLMIRGEAMIDGAVRSHTTNATLSVQAAVSTILTGRVLSTEGDPVLNATVEQSEATNPNVPTTTTTTDAAGAFLLTNALVGRPVKVNGKTAIAPNREYPVIVEPTNIVAGRVNEVPYTFYLPPIDTMFEVPVRNDQNTMVGNPKVQGLQMMIPRGANLQNRNEGGAVMFASITPVPIDRTPAPLVKPDGTPLQTTMVYTSQPGGAQPTNPSVRIPVTYPNLSGEPPYSASGVPIQLWNFNHDTAEWEDAGQGRVSDDGKLIVPLPGAGLKYFSWHFPEVGRNRCNGNCCRDCNCATTPRPVDLSSGMKIETTTDVSFGGARGQIELTRIYTSDLAQDRPCFNCPFGRGTTHNYDIRILAARTTFRRSGAGRISWPLESKNETTGGRLFSWLRTEGGAEVFNSTATPALLGDELRKLSDGSFIYRYRDGRRMEFDADGRLLKIVDRNNNETRLTYTGNNLTRVN